MSTKRSQPFLAPTEQVHPRAEDLDLRSSLEIVRRLHGEDRRAVAAVGKVLPGIARGAELIATCLSRGGRLFYVGAGTSGRLGVLDAAECPPTFGTDPSLVQALIAGGKAALTHAIEGAEDERDGAVRRLDALRLSPDDVVCGISASSATPYVLGALAHARRRGARRILVCCNPAAVKRGSAEVVIAPDTGAELISGSTRLKAGTATKLVLNALSTTAMVRLGKVYRGRMIDVRPTNRKLELRARRMVAELTGLSPAAAAKLLARAGGRPRIAVAMHLAGGLSVAEAEQRLEQESLRELASRRRR